ncbi:MAG: HesA/MoeB/ThiF family protein [Gammaproteobacteria bacterium]|nr:HesA/MoeB/ThiF family protein [Gammaproteobacteria bacterium]MCP5299395.1 HesA/MoeB/ThiF family protein [Chromatiaceae bacterium]
MTPEQRQRYARQIRIDAIGESGQQRLLDAQALVIGLGGLGSPASMYLAASGVGRLVISDFDRVETSNLQRQIAHRELDIGEPKAMSAKRTLEALNPQCRVEAIDWELDDDELDSQIATADIVLDCTDNFASRFRINRAAMANGTPLVTAAAIRREGQILTALPGGRPCYQCVYPEALEHQETCAMEGVLAPVVGVMGSLQALQAIQVLLGDSDALRGSMLLFDAAAMHWQKVRVGGRADCPVCGSR